MIFNKYLVLLRVILICVVIKRGSTSIPNHILHKLESSLTNVEAKTNEMKLLLDQQKKQNILEFSEIKRLLKLMNNKLGAKDETLVSTNTTNSAAISNILPPAETVNQFWRESEQFCGQSQHEILDNVAARNMKNYQYVSTNETLNDCVYLDGLCGGVLVGKKGIISYTAKDSQFTGRGPIIRRTNDRSRCIWTVRTNDPSTQFKVFLRPGNKNGFKLSVTSMQHLLGSGKSNVAAQDATLWMTLRDNTIETMGKWPTENLKFHAESNSQNDVFFITLAYNKSTSLPDFFIQFEGNGTEDKNVKFYHHHRTGEKHQFHAKVNFLRDYDRARNEYATFVINPHDDKKDLQTFQLNLTQVHGQISTQRPEFIAFYQSQGESITYTVAGGKMADNNNRYYANSTFANELIGNAISSEAYIGIFKFSDPSSQHFERFMQESKVKFSW